MSDDSHGGRKTGGFKGNAENAKTRLCTRWKNGHCRFGDRCNFAHGEHELRKLPARGRGGQVRGTGRPSPAPGRGQMPSDKLPMESSQPIATRSPATSIQKAHGTNVAQLGAAHASPDSHASSNAPGMINQLANGGVPDNVWAACGFPLAGANGWVMYRVQETGEPYYHHADRNITQWDQPPDFIEH